MPRYFGDIDVLERELELDAPANSHSLAKLGYLCSHLYFLFLLSWC